MKCSLLLAVGLMCPLSCVAADFATKGGAHRPKGTVIDAAK